MSGGPKSMRRMIRLPYATALIISRVPSSTPTPVRRRLSPLLVRKWRLRVRSARKPLRGVA